MTATPCMSCGQSRAEPAPRDCLHQSSHPRLLQQILHERVDTDRTLDSVRGSIKVLESKGLVRRIHKHGRPFVQLTRDGKKALNGSSS